MCEVFGAYGWGLGAEADEVDDRPYAGQGGELIGAACFFPG
jgi:hypothetical protein